VSNAPQDGPEAEPTRRAGRFESTTVDAVVIGAGHNGLVTAAALADAGWEVLVLEAADTVGGAVASAELFPGYTSDLFSAFYPLSVVSPALTAMELDRHGLRWSHAPTVIAHPAGPHDPDGAVLHREVGDTATALGSRDGQAWLDLFAEWQRIKQPLLRTLFQPFPPVRGPLGLLGALGAAGALRLARFLALPARRMGEELFAGEPARLLIEGNAMHGDAPVDAPVSGAFGYLLAMLAQDVGYPVPVGGAGQLTQAMCRRAQSAGAQVRTGVPVEGIEVRGGRAVAVRTATGERVAVRRAVVADVSAVSLYRRLLPADAVPQRLHRDLENFQWDTPVVKVNYALDSPIPWTARGVRGAGTVHLGADSDGLVRWMADLQTRTLPQKPFMLFGQMTTADPTRSPEGTESAWAYTHLPRGITDDASADVLADRVDEVLQAHAPGVLDHVVARSVQRPSDLEDTDDNLGHGAVNGGTAQLYQQLVFRPVPGLGRAETPVAGLYLGSAAAHPGGGVHGVAGLNAAKAALGEQRRLGWPRRRAVSALQELLLRD
jgi:phytoene dehydrogenase-like protein